MLSELNKWADYAGMAMDLILMVRILTLKLRRTYVYLTLYVLLNLFYDVLELRMGAESTQFGMVANYAQFIYAIVYPLIAWDLFEEAKETVDKVRKLAMSRMLGSLLFISIWALVISPFLSDGDGSHFVSTLAFIIWTGSVAAAIAFLWVMRRGIKANNWELPRNATVWYWFVQFVLVTAVIGCIVGFSLLAFQGQQKTSDLIKHIADAALQVVGIAVTGWCVFSLRPVSTNSSDEAVNVKG